MWVRVLILIVMEERIGYDDISYKRVVNTNVLILIVMEERIGCYKRVVNTNYAGCLNPYCNGRKNRISSTQIMQADTTVLILIVMEERIGFPLGASEPLTRDCCLNPYCNGRKNRIA